MAPRSELGNLVHPLLTVWRDVEVATTRILGNVTLEKLADEYNALRSPVMYHI